MGLKKNIDAIAGIDISNGKATVVILDSKPDDLKQFHRRCKAAEFAADQAGINDLLALNFTAAVMEPTGVHYSKIYADKIAQAGREILWVNNVAISNYRRAHHLPNKNDQADAIALACYGLEHYGKPRFFLSLHGSRVRELYLQLESLNHIKNPMVNRLRQQLAHDFPEVSKKQAGRDWLIDKPPGLWRFIAGIPSKQQWRWEEELARSVGSGISPFSKSLATMICQLEIEEYGVEMQLDECLRGEEFKKYLEVFENYDIANRTAAALLSQIYPLNRFMDAEGRQIIERVENNSKRNRSLSAFKLSLGMGMVQYQSGDCQKWKPGGAKYCRTALWRWCRTSLLMRKENYTPQLKELQEYYQRCPTKGNQKVMKTVSKMVRMLYRDLYKAIQ